MNTKIKKYYMLDPTTNRHHTRKGGGIYKHFPNTCENYNIKEQDVLSIDPHDKMLKDTSFGYPTEIRLVPSSKGFVVVLYYDQLDESHIIFIAQIGSKRGAWQNISWESNFHRNWEEKRIFDAVNNFLWVAECEDAKQTLPKKDYIE